MRRDARKIAVGTGALLLAAVAVLLPQASVQQRLLSDLFPAGPVLFLETRDFAGLVRDWNNSAVKKSWLASGNYKVFSNSRLFLRLKEAQDQFAAAAGIAPDMTLVDAVSGGNSALALYDIGNLEFLYVTRMPQAKAYQSMLWQSRAKFQPRKSANIDYFVRQQQSRTAAFAVSGDLLLLATSEQAMAGALALIGGQTVPAMKQERWYQRAAAAQGAGELRMAINFQRTLNTPYYRSYWIHRNATEMVQFDAIVSDLDRSAAEFRERRVLLRAQPASDQRSGEGAVAEIGKAAPPDAGLVRAWARPDAQVVVAMLEQKLFTPRADAAQRETSAPAAGSMDAPLGSEDDLEVRIDEAPPVTELARADLSAVRSLIAANPVQAMMQVETSRPPVDGVFVTTARAMALLGEHTWDAGAARTAIDGVTTQLWAVAGPPSTLGRVHVAAAGRLLVLSPADDLAAMIIGRSNAAASLPAAQYAMRFLHSTESPRYQRMTTLIDFPNRPTGDGTAHEPLFFSENIASLSRALSRLESAALDSHDDGTAVRQNVVYRLR